VPLRAHLTPLNIAATMGAPALVAFALLAGLALDGLAQDIDHFRHVWVMIGLADADRALGEDGRRGARMERPTAAPFRDRDDVAHGGCR
jgi:hypothetical protein